MEKRKERLLKAVTETFDEALLRGECEYTSPNDETKHFTIKVGRSAFWDVNSVVAVTLNFGDAFWQVKVTEHTERYELITMLTDMVWFYLFEE